jgi:hypothetical protein
MPIYPLPTHGQILEEYGGGLARKWTELTLPMTWNMTWIGKAQKCVRCVLQHSDANTMFCHPYVVHFSVLTQWQRTITNLTTESVSPWTLRVRDTIARICDSLLWSRAGAVTPFAELQGHRDPWHQDLTPFGVRWLAYDKIRFLFLLCVMYGRAAPDTVYCWVRIFVGRLLSAQSDKFSQNLSQNLKSW